MNDDTPIVKSTTEAREAVTGHNVRYSLAGTAIVLVGLWFYYFA
jgi:hypothetical protein